MAPQTASLRRFPGTIRLAMLGMSIIGLIFIGVACGLHGTERFVGYEAGLIDYISLTSFCYTIAWSISALCVLLFHGQYHPGIDIGLDFLGWGLGWGFGIAIMQWSVEMSYSETYMTAIEFIAALMAIFYGACHLWMIVEAIKSLMARRRGGVKQAVDLNEQA